MLRGFCVDLPFYDEKPLSSVEMCRAGHSRLIWNGRCLLRLPFPLRSGRQPVHDDRLVWAALVSVYDELVLTGLLRMGRGKSTVIRAEDPLDDQRF